jgi:micrococcal nuclease|tara:strand:+ start:559 stop:1047 length:489 start_codon:yes stop_codon:yes gene_type:complete
MYEYRCKVTRVVDGDTVDVVLDLGFSIDYRDRVRLMGIDTPESRTRNLVEKKLGLASKATLKELCILNKGNIILQTSKEGKGKFGRILGSLYVPALSNVSFNQLLIDEGHARPYYGGSKDELGEWTKEENCSYNCQGKKLTKSRVCDGTWYRWTKNGYVQID